MQGSEGHSAGARAARRRGYALVLLFALATPGCSGCRQRGTAARHAALRFAPADAQVLLLVPSVQVAIRQARKLLDALGQSPILTQLISSQRQELVRELGFDPDQPEALKQRGLDPASALVLTLDADGESLGVVVGVSDPALAEQQLQELLRRTAGGQVSQQQQAQGGVKVSALVRQGEAQPELAWAVVDRQLIFCPRARQGQVVQHVARLVTLQNSAREHAPFLEATSRLGQHQAVLYLDGASLRRAASEALARQQQADPGASATRRLQETQQQREAIFSRFSGLALSLYLSGKGVVLEGHAPWVEGKGGEVVALLQGKGEAAPPLGQALPADALMLARISLDARQVLDRVLEVFSAEQRRALYRDLARVEQETKISLEKELMPLLAGRYAAAFFAPGAEAFQQGVPGRAEEMLSRVPWVVLGQVTDAAGAADLLARLERLLTLQRAEVRIETRGQGRIYHLQEQGREVAAFGLLGKVVFLTSPALLDSTLQRLTQGTKASGGAVDQLANPRARELVNAADGAILHLDLARATRQLTAMEMSTSTRMVLAPVTQFLSRFADLTFSLQAEKGSLHAEAALRFN